MEMDANKVDRLRVRRFVFLLFCRCAVFAAIALAIQPMVCAADNAHHPEMSEDLRLIADSIRSAYLSIDTWKAVYSLVERKRLTATSTTEEIRKHFGAKPIFADLQCELQFTFDRRKRLLFEEWKQGSDFIVTDLNGDTLNGSSYRSFWRWILRPECMLEFEPTGTFGQVAEFPAVSGIPAQGAGLAKRVARSDSKKTIDRLYDPEDMFSTDSFLFHELYEGWAELLKNEHNQSDAQALRVALSVTREISHGEEFVIVKRSRPAGRPFTTESRHMVSASYLPIQFTIIHDDKLHARRSWSWTSINGALIPKTFVLELFDLRTGALFHSSELALQSAEINSDVDEKQFDVPALGLLPGDRLWDKLASELKVVTPSGDMVSVEEYNKQYAETQLLKKHALGGGAPPTAVAPNTAWARSRLLIAGNTVALSAIGFAVAFVRWKRRR